MNMGQMMQMMQKAQTIQKKLQDTQSELANTEFTGEAGGVVAICDGQGKFKSIKISKEAINPQNTGFIPPGINISVSYPKLI